MKLCMCRVGKKGKEREGKEIDMQVIQHLRAVNDINGNPRRVWVVYDLNNTSNGSQWADICQVHDEGYGGKPRSLEGLTNLPTLVITVSGYKDLMRDNGKWQVFHS